jgi:CBS domain-containing protein
VIVEKTMTSDVEACSATDSLSEAAAVMWRKDCGAVPVIDDERRVVGIVTDRDIAMAVSTRGQAASEITVGEVMSSPARTCTSADDIREALEVMAEGQIRRLPVIDGSGRLAGILSINDIILHSKRGKAKKHVSHGEAMEVLKAIARPHSEAAAEQAEVKARKGRKSKASPKADEEKPLEPESPPEPEIQSAPIDDPAVLEDSRGLEDPF